MPTAATTRKARSEMRHGYSATTAAGEFVREEMHHKKAGKHGPESRKQAIAIGLSKARKAGLPIGKAPKRKPSRTRGTMASRSSARKSARRTTQKAAGRRPTKGRKTTSR